MRVISGFAKGRTLYGPKGEGIRPAIDKVKQAVFNILGPVEGFQVMDLFAGTGSVGIEALSRGASFGVFVDFGSEALSLVQKNLHICQMEASAKIIKWKLPVGLHKALQKILKRTEGFDLVFVDPPYDKGLVAPSLKEVFEHRLVKEGGEVVVEHSPREEIPENDLWRLRDQRKYGQTYISFLVPN